MSANAAQVVLELLRLAEVAVGQLGTPAPAPEPDRWMSLAEAAEYASVTPGTLREWIAAGHVRHGRTGREFRLRRSDLDAYLLRHELESASLSSADLSARAGEILASVAR